MASDKRVAVWLYSAWFLVFLLHFCFFFFQAEDGIRDTSVTGVQTCALPIFSILNEGDTPIVNLSVALRIEILIV